MIFVKAIYDDIKNYIKHHQIEDAKPLMIFFESMMNLANDIETSKIVKERKCESSYGLCTSDWSIVNILE